MFRLLVGHDQWAQQVYIKRRCICVLYRLVVLTENDPHVIEDVVF
jgi:hypothetical protein